jgi:RNA polymerase sigma factor (sigma-70 family)
VLDAVRSYDPGCIPILLTGFGTVELAVSALTEHGAFNCLRKETFNRTQFREIVTSALSAPSIPATGRTTGMPITSTPKIVTTRTGGELALLVEDDAGWRGILGELLEDAGYQTRQCASFGEAFGCLRREKYALAIVDLSLSGASLRSVAEEDVSVQNMDGYRLLASTRAGGVPTIVVSGMGSPVDIERAYDEQGIFAYLEKRSLDRHAFLQTVAEARSARRSVNELDGLTEREREVLDLLARGMTNKEIAEVLVITTNTVKRHLKSIFEKLQIHTRSAAAAKAITGGIIPE